jgi:hypothetical protein
MLSRNMMLGWAAIRRKVVEVLLDAVYQFRK